MSSDWLMAFLFDVVGLPLLCAILAYNEWRSAH